VLKDNHPYDLKPARDYCASLNMPVDEEGLLMAALEAAQYGLSQEQFDAGIRVHAWRVKWLFDRNSYTFWGRLGLACYFLFGLGAK